MNVGNPLFRRALPPAQSENPYARYGLTQNPFPTAPTIVPGSDDPRNNGAIYRPELRAAEQRRFEELLIPGAIRPEQRPFALLMDRAAGVGRGIGKSAFLLHQRDRIMADLGETVSGGAAVLVAAYVIPDVGGRTRKFWQFTRQIAHALNGGQCIAWALWRLRGEHLAVMGTDLAEVDLADLGVTLGDDRWLLRQGVDVTGVLRPQLERALSEQGISEEVAQALAAAGTPADVAHHLLRHWGDTRWRTQGDHFVFNELPRLFHAAGITRAIILVDEVERIVGPQNSQERRAFVDDLRRCFVDGPFESVYTHCYRVLLTLHPYLQELWTPHWNAAGLERVCPLSGPLVPDYTVYFEPLKGPDDAVELAAAYLAYPDFRLDRGGPDDIRPFDRSAVIEAASLSGGVPGLTLALLRAALEWAVRDGWSTIGVEQIRTVRNAAAHMRLVVAADQGRVTNQGHISDSSGDEE